MIASDMDRLLFWKSVRLTSG